MDKLTELMQQAQSRLGNSKSLVELDDIRVHYLGKKGLITEQLKQSKNNK